MKNISTNVEVQKASGENEPFSLRKLVSSLESSGANSAEIEHITDNISGWVYNGVSTQQIYKRAYDLLRQRRNHLASRYKLKKAIMELGPTGYPFEHFVARVFDTMGFSTMTGQVLNGCCITHEIDVVAFKDKEEHLVECKYGQSSGKTVSVQVPLYVRSRVNDIVQKQKESKDFEGFTFHGWVVTNTRFTTDAVDYGKCSGLHLLSWDYPAGKGMKDLIDQGKIYPITVLASLTHKQKQLLLKQGIVICRQLITEYEVLNDLNLSNRQYHVLMDELKEIA